MTPVSEGEGKDFILLCEAILEDGEVSAEEAYGIAEWLNDHPEVARTWPATELTKPLQEIWADGSVNRRELHRLARLLVRLQRDWTAKPERKISGAARIELPAFASAESGGPQLPKLEGTMSVPSWDEPGVRYKVDLVGPRCTCPDWRGRRSHLPSRHLSRCCKHIFAAYAQLPRSPRVEPWLLAYIDYGWPPHPRADWELLTLEKEKILISSAANKGWANVFAKEDGEYKRFGYNLEEHRWAYGSEPAWPWVITDAIRALDEKAKGTRTSSPGDSRPVAPALVRPKQSTNGVWAIIFVGIVGCGIAFFLHSKGDARAPRRVTAPKVEAWTARTNRDLRVSAGNREVVIPKGTQLRVIARAGRDVMVSYNGTTVTIPSSATDLK